MISVEEARRIFALHTPTSSPENVLLERANGRFLSADVVASFDHPLFDCSAVDGYAFAYAEHVIKWKVVGSIPAGEVLDRSLGKGECARIFTGAMLPEGAETVVMQEFVERDGDRIRINDPQLRKGANVRYRGEQLRAGDQVLTTGTHVNAGAIGLCASVGIAAITVAQLPRVAVLVSGNEFTSPAQPEKGKIFSSNDVMLQAAFRTHGIDPTMLHVPDDHDDFIDAWRAVKDHDLIISTGGVSVGDHDLVLPTLQELGATVHFHKVAQKPGKPMLFAELDGVPVIGLPGNPRAVMVLFHEYVLPFMRAMQGASEPGPHGDRLPILNAITVKGDRAEFRAARVSNGRVELLADEGSHMLHSLIGANALAYIPATVRKLDVGDPVEVHYLPR